MLLFAEVCNCTILCWQLSSAHLVLLPGLFCSETKLSARVSDCNPHHTQPAVANGTASPSCPMPDLQRLQRTVPETKSRHCSENGSLFVKKKKIVPPLSDEISPSRRQKKEEGASQEGRRTATPPMHAKEQQAFRQNVG